MERSTLITISGVILLSILGGLAAWYFLLKNQSADIAFLGVARNLGSEAPLADARGSTFQNTTGASSIGGVTQSGGGTLAGTEVSQRDASAGISFGFGQALQNIAEQLGISTTPTTPVEPTLERLTRVHESPVAGSRFFLSEGTSTLRFVERSTGHVYEVDPRTGTERRLTNTLIPRVYRAQFGSDGTIFGTTVSDTQGETTFSTPFVATTTTYVPLEPVSLGNRMLDIAPSIGTTTLYAVTRSGGGSALTTSQWDGSKPNVLFSSNLTHWRIYPRLTDAILVEKSATGVSGSAFVIDTETARTLERNQPGLNILPHASSSAYLYSTDTGTLTLSVRLDEQTTSTTLPIRTIAEKCVWGVYSRKGDPLIAYCAVPQSVPQDFTDAWYQGRAHTTDSWWRINASSGEVEELFTPDRGYDTAIDVEYPVIDERGEYIGFINAADKSLWLLRIKE